MTTVIALRPLRMDDAPVMAEVLAAAELYRYTGGEPPSVSDLARQYAVQTVGHSTDGNEQWLNRIVLAGLEQQAVGYVQATMPADGSPTEIAWVIGLPWQGRGYASHAVSALSYELRNRGVTRVMAHIHPGHAASQRVARGLGMEPTEQVVDGEVRWVGALA